MLHGDIGTLIEFTAAGNDRNGIRPIGTYSYRAIFRHDERTESSGAPDDELEPVGLPRPGARYV